MTDDVDNEALASRRLALQLEAAEVLAVLAEAAVVRDLGGLLTVGSYISGLMCWRDLDVGTLVGPDFTPGDVALRLARLLATYEITHFSYRDERGERCPTGQRRDERYHVPLGLPWSGNEWRVDLTLWLYDDHANVAEFHRSLAQRISPAERRAVLRIKDVWCRKPNYPDEIGGADIYRAVMEDGVRTPDEFGVWSTRLR